MKNNNSSTSPSCFSQLLCKTKRFRNEKRWSGLQMWCRYFNQWSCHIYTILPCCMFYWLIFWIHYRY